MDLIQTLQNLEQVFVEAGDVAVTMQKTAKHYKKFDTGNPVSDIVTEADLAVQELLLETISKTELVECRLMAEEKTALTRSFNSEGKYYLAIDPIDGTAIYAKDGRCFSQIISLHDGKKFLYMYVRYPKLNWTLKIINNTIQISGQTFDFQLPPEAKKTIVYWHPDQYKYLPAKIIEELKAKGFNFTQINAFGEDVSSIIMLASSQIGGVLDVDPNVYDGLTEYCIGSAKGLKTYSVLNLTQIKERTKGLYYPGYSIELT